MSSALARPLMRTTARTLPSRLALRFESTASKKASESAKDAAGKASEYSAKAAQGLSRAASAAGPALSGAVSALGKVGGRTGKVINFIEKQVPWVIYYSRVGLELSKIVFHGQKMAPPPVSTFQSYFQNAVGVLKNPSTLLSSVSSTAGSAASAAAAKPATFASRINTATVAFGAVVAAECLGFFTVGEMLGRLKLVGYHGETHAAHH
ncbi:Putative ATP synthase, F0 complex, subunit G [Colletotrichum destructivum]|uniref:ATP synthase, F0 complex, subunit G n=1 Tax=Colletotrichum destructivum TaxID=34406 RepID=A0AAX4IVB7_9PEZI|nr:Putative ATP synthase, F0 complex, subunit G [Colletotrichum destructivum]